MRTLLRYAACAVLLLTSAGSFAAAPGAVDAMRGNTPLTEEPTSPPLPTAENKDLRRGRAFSMQPPTIPHKIEGYQIDKSANRCLFCHSRNRTEETQAVPLSVTHYMDRQNNVHASVSARRYFCTTCHVEQMDAKPLVGNTFKDAETLIGDSAKPKTQRKPTKP